MENRTKSHWKIAGVLAIAAASFASSAHAGYDEKASTDSDSVSSNSSMSQSSMSQDSMSNSSKSSDSSMAMKTSMKTDAPMSSKMVVSSPRLTTMALGGRTRNQVRYVDPQMKAVLISLMELKPKPIEKLTPAQARRQPGPADAVKRTLQKQGRSTVPEAVGSVMDTTVPGPAGRIPVRVYKPITSNSDKLPVLVYFHGGGFVIAGVQAYDSSCRALANAAKCMVVSVDYCYAPEHRLPAAHEDSYAATQWVMNNVEKWGGDHSRVAVGGESAGGNLATDMCLMARDRGGKMPIYQMLVYPLVDFTPASANAPSVRANAYAKPLNRAMLGWFGGYALPRKSFAFNPLASPLKRANLRGLPAATVVLAEIDPLLSQGEAYVRKLRASGVPVRAKLYKGVTHEFFGMGAVINQAKDAVNFAAEGLDSAFNR